MASRIGGEKERGKIGKYKIVKLLYEGSAVKVFSAESEMHDRVAIKQCRKPNSKEVENLLALKRWDSDCKHVVKIIDCIEASAADEAAALAAVSEMSTFLVLELGDRTLDAWLRERRFQPSWAEVLEVGYALGQALEWIHDHSLVHSDVKPANCMSMGGRWKLVDFAAASKEGEKCTELASTYVAPEQARAYLAGQEVLATKDADIWAYGKILFEMACGVPTSLVKDDADPHTDIRSVLEVPKMAHKHRASRLQRSFSWLVQDIATLQGDIETDKRMRFPVLRTLYVRPPPERMLTSFAKGDSARAACRLKDTLSVATPRMAMSKVQRARSAVQVA
jgi:serine/threonine protein kinase